MGQDRAEASLPWWLRLGTDIGTTSETCSVDRCTAPLLAVDLYCPKDEGLLVFQGRHSRSRVLVTNLARAAVAGAFVLTALWNHSWPLAIGIMSVGALVLGLPLRGYAVARRVALGLWGAIAIAYLVTANLPIPDRTVIMVATVLAGVVLATFILYTGRASYLLARQNRGDGNAAAAVVVTAAATLGSGAILTLTWLWQGPLHGLVLPAPDWVVAWASRGGLGGLAATTLTVAIGAFMRSGQTVNRVVQPFVGEPDHPDPVPPLPPVSSDRGSPPVRSVRARLARSLMQFRSRVLRVLAQLAKESRHLWRVVAYQAARCTVAVVNAAHGAATRAMRRIRETCAHAWRLLAAGADLGTAVLARYSRGIGLPVLLLVAAGASALVAAEHVRLYMDVGGLLNTAVALAFGCITLLALSGAWIAWSGLALATASDSLIRTMAFALPNAFVLFVLGCWAIGIPGTFGWGPIAVGPVTGISTALLVVSLVSLKWAPDAPGPPDGAVTQRARAGPLSQAPGRPGLASLSGSKRAAARMRRQDAAER